MKSDFTVDDSALRRSLDKSKLTTKDMLVIEGSGGKVLINGMRMRVPVDTAATKISIQQHLTEVSEKRITDEVGPETNYAPSIEYGVGSKPNYPMQPFIRPTAMQDFGKVITAIGQAFAWIVNKKWLA